MFLFASNRRIAFLILLAIGLVAVSAPPADAAEIRTMTFPIQADRAGDVRWTDTWGAARSGGRSHIGVDMLGQKMIPLVAVKSGTITWGKFDNRGGNYFRFRDDDGWEYQYIHLNNDTPGTDDGSAACTQVYSAAICATVGSDGRLAKGTRITEGEIIGYMGDSGNAEGTSPHLHFEVYRPNGSGVTPINPTASVNAALARIGAPAGTDGAADGLSPLEPGQDGFISHLWDELYGRQATTTERAAFNQQTSREGRWEAAADHVGPDSTVAAIDRLYLAFFLRTPDIDGLRYWTDSYGSGESLEDVAELFAQSDEFSQRYAGTDFGAFLDQLYREVLGREPDEEGKSYWLGLLDEGTVSRGTIVVYFTQSDELKGRTGQRGELVSLVVLRHGRAPSADDTAAWTTARTSKTLPEAIAAFYAA